MALEQGRIVPEMYGGKKAVYYCPYCESIPSVGEGEIAVGSTHPECAHRALKEAIAGLNEVSVKYSTAFLTGILRPPHVS